MYCILKNKKKKIEEYYKESAKQGDPAALINWSQCLGYDNKELEINVQNTAFINLQYTADQGDSMAQLQLSIAYERDCRQSKIKLSSTTRLSAVAFDYIERSAKSGNAFAQLKIGRRIAEDPLSHHYKRPLEYLYLSFNLTILNFIFFFLI